MPKKRLGKGLEALITSYSTEGNERYLDGSVPTNKIIPNHNQPRQEFDILEMDNLTKSIKRSGILQPLTVREIDDEKYELIAGERRLRAALSLGFKTVPVYILSVEADVEMMEYALVENIQRVDLNPVEEAEAYAMLSGKFELSHDDIARRVGKNRSTIANSLRLLKLPPEIKSALKTGKISSGHARAILSLRKSIYMLTLYRKIIREGLNVRQTERLSKKYSDNSISKTRLKNNANKNSKILRLEHRLISLFDTHVLIQKNTNGRGKIHIDFYNDKDLKRILQILDIIDE
jgi:ParB family chromosome partitioning protein